MQTTDWWLPEWKRAGGGNMSKAGQLYGDGWKLDFGDERAILYTDIELRCTPETHIML